MIIPKLILVGAGPGSEDLITLRGARALANANVIIYDALADESLLVHANENCIKIFAGKKYGCSILSQHEINNLIIENALKYGTVVRLKGGDPFVFGRATEEIDAAREFGIDVEIIPGVSSCIAVPAAEFIPVTSRGISESFWVITGTTKSGEISKDIYLAAQSSATIIILMAMSKIEKIVEIFKTFEKGNTPVMIVQDGWTKNQKTIIGNISEISTNVKNYNISNPAVIIIGEVVSLHPKFKKVIQQKILEFDKG